MDPSQILALLPFLKSLLPNAGAPGVSAPPAGGASPMTEQNIAPAGMGPVQPAQNLGNNMGLPVSRPMTGAAAPAGSGSLGQLQDYTALMKAIKDIDPGLDSKPPMAGAFKFSSPAMSSQPWAQQPGMQRQQPVNSVGAYLASPAGQQILAQLRAMSQGQY